MFNKSPKMLFCLSLKITSSYQTLSQALDISKKTLLTSSSSSKNFVDNQEKGRISKQVFRKNKTRQIFQKTSKSFLLIRSHTCAYQGGKKCSFFGKFGVLCFLETPVLRFALLPYYRRFINITSSS